MYTKKDILEALKNAIIERGMAHIALIDADSAHDVGEANFKHGKAKTKIDSLQRTLDDLHLVDDM